MYMYVTYRPWVQCRCADV